MRVKRTYNLREDLVLAVRDAVDERHVAPSQDALVERALADLLLALKYADEARQFSELARDPSVQTEIGGIDDDLRAAEADWPE